MALITGVTTIQRDFETEAPFGFVFHLEGDKTMSIKMDGSDWRAEADISCASIRGMKGATFTGMGLEMCQGVSVVVKTSVGDYKFELKGPKGRRYVVEMGAGNVVYGCL